MPRANRLTAAALPTQAAAGVLNPLLYQKLKQLFGRVRVADPGAGFRGNEIYDSARRRHDLRVADPGEYYCVNCRYCGDQRQRLWINHRFGEFGSDNRRMLHLAICYNEDCLRDWSRRLELADQIFGLHNRNNRDVNWVAAAGEQESDRLTVATLPGECIPIAHLPADHIARQYLTVTRRYSLEILTQYQTCFCVRALPQYRPAEGRIVLPIFMNGQLVGWQARWPEDLNWKATGRIKFYSMPGMPKRQVLYNWDIAQRYPFIVVCEGIMSSWNVGPHAVALLGKTCAMPQQHLLTMGRQQTIVLLLDGGATERKNMTDIIQQLLNQPGASGRAIVPVTLPDGRDPGSYDPRNSREILHNVIRTQAAAMGVTL